MSQDEYIQSVIQRAREAVCNAHPKERFECLHDACFSIGCLVKQDMLTWDQGVSYCKDIARAAGFFPETIESKLVLYLKDGHSF